MNLRSFSMALLISALPLFALADGSVITLDKADFISAKPAMQNGETVVDVKLSKSGKAKIKKLNAHLTTSVVRTSIAGTTSTLKVREPLRGGALELGPYSEADASKIIAEVNHR